MAQTTQGDNCAATSSYNLLVVREKDRKSKPGAARHCCVPGCTSDNRYWKSDSPVWFHTFPKDPDLKKAWIVKIRRDEGSLFKVNLIM